MKLALFDFDGTLTSEDSYTAFLYYCSSKLRICLTIIFIWPVILGYKLGLIKGTTLRPILSKAALWRKQKSIVDQLGIEFAKQRMPDMLSAEMIEKLRWHKEQGHTIYVVSASLEPYMKPFCHTLEVELICTELEVHGTRYTGRYLDGDCTGQNKVNFIEEQISLSDFESIYAYGDSVEDLPMLAVADHAYMRGQPI